MKCDKCEMLSINGIACHETGCPNSGARWDGDSWIAQQTCFICGYDFDKGELCCDHEDYQTDSDEFEEAQS